jgi:hypothetical protein
MAELPAVGKVMIKAVRRDAKSATDHVRLSTIPSLNLGEILSVPVGC